MAHNINTEATTTRAFQRGRRRRLIKLDAQRSGPRGTHAQREEGHARAATSSPSHTCGKKLEAFPLDQGGGEPRASSSTRHSAGSPSHGPLRLRRGQGPGWKARHSRRVWRSAGARGSLPLGVAPARSAVSAPKPSRSRVRLGLGDP